ncbi:MAG: hypothetical protein HYZ02_01620, partial [Candidatus Levybacteria bacterium]|nr:hypothetical protein [Candidatus Levybacteria bacterium]
MQFFIILFLGLVVTQILWVFTDPRPLKERLEPKILKTYLLVAVVVLAQAIGFLFFQLPQTPYNLTFILNPDIIPLCDARDVEVC